MTAKFDPKHPRPGVIFGILERLPIGVLERLPMLLIFGVVIVPAIILTTLAWLFLDPWVGIFIAVLFTAIVAGMALGWQSKERYVPGPPLAPTPIYQSPIIFQNGHAYRNGQQLW